MSDTQTVDRRIPAWLAPYKNEWRSLYTFQYLFSVEGRPLSSWLAEIQPRLRCVTKPTTNGKGTARYYLVKQIWACSLAHGLKLLPAAQLQPRDEAMQALMAELSDLRSKLFVQSQRPAEVRIVDRTPDHMPMFKALLTATEPRPLPGVYFLIEGEEITYVGQSQNVLARMHGHTGKTFNTVKMIHVPDSAVRLAMEARLISAFATRDNVKGLENRRTA